MDQAPPMLPAASWFEDSHLSTKDGGRLRKWGTVKDACKVLDGCDRQVIYDLHHSKQIRAYKGNPQAKNSHLKVDLLSVWEHKQKQLCAA